MTGRALRLAAEGVDVTAVGNAGNKLHKIPERIRQDMIDVNLSGGWKSVKAAVPRLISGGRSQGVQLPADAGCLLK